MKSMQYIIICINQGSSISQHKINMHSCVHTTILLDLINLTPSQIVRPSPGRNDTTTSIHHYVKPLNNGQIDQK